MAYPHHGRVAALLRLGEWARADSRGRWLHAPFALEAREGKLVRQWPFRNEFAITDAQRFLHAIAQSLASEGFWQEVIGARSESMGVRNLSAHSRDEHDRNSRGRRVAPEDLTNRKAIYVR